MNKILILSVGLLCILLAVQGAKQPEKSATQADESDDDDEAVDDLEGEEEEAETENPTSDLNCVLFGDTGCDATCAGISYLYGGASRGNCVEDRSCACTEQKTDSTLPFLWKEKFEENPASQKLLQKITNNSELAEQVLEILQRSPRTPSNTLDELTNEISDLAELKNLKMKKAEVPVLQYVDKSDKVDRKKLQNSFSNMLKKALQQNLFSIKNVNFNANLKNFIDEISDDDETLEYFHDEILKTDNAILKKHLGPDFAKTSFDFNSYAADVPSFELVPEYVAATVADEFVKFINRNKTTPKKSPKKPVTKSPKNSVTKSPSPPTKTAKNPIKKDLEASDEDTNKYFTPDTEDLTSIEHASGGYNKTWRFKNGQVSMNKSASGAILVDWKKGNTAVTLMKYASGAIDQTWHFVGNVTIRIIKNASGAIDHSWSVGDKQYEYHKYASGAVDATNDIPSTYRTKYGQEMEQWCTTNRKFFPLSDCTIYNER